MDRDCMDLSLIANECRHNSERWFPELHDGTTDMAVFYALGLAGEAGEVANEIKKYMRYKADRVDLRDKIEMEIGDVFTYWLLLADELHIDPFEAFRKAQAKCEERWGAGAQARSVQ